MAEGPGDADGAGAADGAAQGTALSWETFCDTHEKLTRALQRSQLTQANMLEQCRRLKDQVVAKSSQLRVALHQKQVDDETMSALRRQAEAAMASSNASKRKEASTEKLLKALRLELDVLRSKLARQDDLADDIERLRGLAATEDAPATAAGAREFVSDFGGRPLTNQGRPTGPTETFRGVATTSRGAASAAVPRAWPSPAARASPMPRAGEAASRTAPRTAPMGGQDFADLLSMSHESTKASKVLAELTPFQKWKADHKIVTPDTPAASAHFLLLSPLDAAAGGPAANRLKAR
ncbi:hypothetical protein M885DRAFT_535174 [Pelagophyceae sp. CCMP2097]|nr:hypothetical protein M885DRAFT_535174 [Pelagophyceae sp. CCMP2097]